MASLALQPLVRAFEIKTRLLVVIELPAVPANRVMTLCAATAEQALVLVIVGMAIAAFRWRARELLVGVARLATDRRVLPQQRKHREIVVERNALHPAVFVVALLAGLAHRVFMHVVAFVTTTAGFVRNRFVHIVDMALLAACLAVLAAQRKFCAAVIEPAFAPTDVVMTLLALRAVAPFVHVVGLVATVAGFFQLLRANRLRVALRA